MMQTLLRWEKQSRQLNLAWQALSSRLLQPNFWRIMQQRKQTFQTCPGESSLPSSQEPVLKGMYLPVASGSIVGILKQMHDEMSGDEASATKEEEESIKAYEGLMAAKTKEVNALTAQIEVEMKRVGELGVEIAVAANDLEETTASLGEDEKFLLELEKGCSTKTQEWEEIKKIRAEELVTLADTIKVLNDDDALEIFKNTLSSIGENFMEIIVRAAIIMHHTLPSFHASFHALFYDNSAEKQHDLKIKNSC